MCDADASSSRCHVYAPHRSIVAQVVPSQGYVANPTCRGLTHVLFNWSSMLLLQSESFVNLHAFSLKNDAPLVSNERLIAIIGVYLKLSFEIMTCCEQRILLVTFLSGPLRNQHQTATPSLSYLNMD